LNQKGQTDYKRDHSNHLGRRRPWSQFQRPS